MMDLIQTDSRSAVQYSCINMKTPNGPMLAQATISIWRLRDPKCRGAAGASQARFFKLLASFTPSLHLMIIGACLVTTTCSAC